MIGAESIAHRARFAWLGLALAATIALLVAPSLREPPRAQEPERIQRVLRKQHGCFRAPRDTAAARAARAEYRARHEAVRAERRALREAARAERAERRARIFGY